jgi:hypothetical protein
VAVTWKQVTLVLALVFQTGNSMLQVSIESNIEVPFLLQNKFVMF